MFNTGLLYREKRCIYLIVLEADSIGLTLVRTFLSYHIMVGTV
jgi:hypothetical protein